MNNRECPLAAIIKPVRQFKFTQASTITKLKLTIYPTKRLDLKNHSERLFKLNILSNIHKPKPAITSICAPSNHDRHSVYTQKVQSPSTNNKPKSRQPRRSASLIQPNFSSLGSYRHGLKLPFVLSLPATRYLKKRDLLCSAPDTYSFPINALNIRPQKLHNTHLSLVFREYLLLNELTRAIGT
jgi:hypothetical protein